MGKYAKDKGHGFERLVAKMVANALGVSAKDCHRTPLSGGYHVKGDIVVDHTLRKRFPYTVECKHSKSWNIGHLLPVSATMARWLAQAQEQAKVEEQTPLLVLRGHCTPIFAVLWSTSQPLPDGYIKFRWKDRELTLVQFQDWLKGVR